MSVLDIMFSFSWSFARISSMAFLSYLTNQSFDLIFCWKARIPVLYEELLQKVGGSIQAFTLKKKSTIAFKLAFNTK